MATDKIEVELFIDDRKADATLRANKTKFDNFADSVGEKIGVSMTAGLAGIAAAAGAVALAGAGALAKLVKDASDYGSIIFDASQKTGLAAESISTLKFNAENAGSSLDQLTAGIAKFAKSQSSTATLDVELEKVFKKIADAKPGIEQLTIAQEAFGRSGGDLIPVILQMGGSLTEAKAEAERLGIALDGTATQAADNFGDALGTISAQAEAASAKFALEFAPAVTSAMTDISKALGENQDVWKQWGQEVSNIITGTKGLLDAFLPDGSSSALQKQGLTNLPYAALGPVLGGLAKGISEIGSYIDNGSSASIAAAEAQIAKNKAILDRIKASASPSNAAPGSTIKGTGLAFTDDEKWREGNKQYFANFQAGLKAQAEAEKKYAEDRKKMIDEAIKKAKEWADYVKNARTSIAETFASSTDNPFVRIFSAAEKAIDRVTAATSRLGGNLTKTLTDLIANKAAVQAFGQSLENSLKAAGLRNEASLIDQGTIEEQAKRRLFPNYFTKEAREAHLQNEIKFLTQNQFQNQLREQIAIMYAARSPSESAEISRRRDQALIAATQGLTGNQLGAFKTDAMQARLREAAALENEKTEAKKLKAEEIAAFKELAKAIGEGSIVRIVNEAPDNAKVGTRPRRADSNAYFGK